MVPSTWNAFPLYINIAYFFTLFKSLLQLSHAAAAKSLQSCLTLCDPIDGSPPGSAVPGILQARTLEWLAISFSNACKWKMKVKLLSRVWLFATPWTAAYQAPPSMGFSRQEYWSGVPLPSLQLSHEVFPKYLKIYPLPSYSPLPFISALFLFLVLSFIHLYLSDFPHYDMSSRRHIFFSLAQAIILYQEHA